MLGKALIILLNIKLMNHSFPRESKLSLDLVKESNKNFRKDKKIYNLNSHKEIDKLRNYMLIGRGYLRTKAYLQSELG